MPQVSLPQLIDALAKSPQLISFPTDTVPALATRPEHSELIYAAKQRAGSKPLILMGASLADLLPYVSAEAEAQAAWMALANQHWPGQLTLVLPTSHYPFQVLQEGTQNQHTLGIRVPNHPVALELLAQSGPLATTSANLSGQPPLTRVADIARTFPTALTLPDEAFEDADKRANKASGTPSTVVKWTKQGWHILRQGAVNI
ncbi:MAG: hypothetical protein DCF15_06895 [Phormidesmis priestleyi]|uniref:L-threonylcarbamoyladenylate synthase n=1 Tax=Phormidesmis priestleyi TaxID=268141 RepID=A0A2W4XJV7_9CYAN|nr:MAG: hypothetical protein DCF15_06895 [Phormidesmis priestleyi]